MLPDCWGTTGLGQCDSFLCHQETLCRNGQGWGYRDWAWAFPPGLGFADMSVTKEPFRALVGSLGVQAEREPGKWQVSALGEAGGGLGAGPRLGVQWWGLPRRQGCALGG